MPLPIDLDTRFWIRFAASPAKSEVVRVRGNACYYSLEAAPPELKNPGEVTTTATTIELAENGEVAVEGPTWFLNKMSTAERKNEAAFKPAILETLPAVLEGIGTTEILNEAVTEPKIAKEAVSPTKLKPPTTPAVAAVKTVKVGAMGSDRVVNCNLKGDGGTTLIYKIKHELKTEDISVTFQKDNAGKPGEPMVSPVGAAGKIEPEGENELKLTFETPKPANNEVVWVRVEG